MLRVSSEFDDQYLTIEATPEANGAAPARGAASEEDFAASVASFANAATCNVEHWSKVVGDVTASGERTVLWGSGSKAVAFLSALGEAGSAIEYLVDINPHRWERFVPGTGEQIVRPEFLSVYRPDLVIAMNPIYRREITTDLKRVGCETSRLMALGEAPRESVAAAAAPVAELRA